MHTKRAGFALLAAALLIAVVGSVVSANVLRVGMTDYEVYPCNYNANAGYYVPWDGNAAGQFWISAPVWEWGGEGGALCADSDGDWRDNGVREGDPNPNFGDEYRRAQSAVNARQAAFSASLVSLAEQIERGIREEAERLAAGGDPLLLYQSEVVGCYETYNVARAAATTQAERDAAEAAYISCLETSIRTYPASARTEYNTRLTALQTSCRAANPTNDEAYNNCVSSGRVGAGTSEDCTYAVARRAAAAIPGRTYTLRERGPNNQIIIVYVDGSEDRQSGYCTQYDTPIIDPEVTLNPSPTPTPDPSPTPAFASVAAAEAELQLIYTKQDAVDDGDEDWDEGEEEEYDRREQAVYDYICEYGTEQNKEDYSCNP